MMNKKHVLIKAFILPPWALLSVNKIDKAKQLLFISLIAIICLLSFVLINIDDLKSLSIVFLSFLALHFIFSILAYRWAIAN